MAYYNAGQTLTAALLLGALPFGPIKPTDESVNNAGTGTTLHNDTALVVAGAANTIYKVDVALLITEATGTAIDFKSAWTQPTGCILDLAVVAPHVNWVAGAGTALEVEWSGWQNETGTTTATRSFGTATGVNFSLHFRGTWRVGGTGGNLQLQWAQNTGAAGNLTVKAGSSLFLTPIL